MSIWAFPLIYSSLNPFFTGVGFPTPTLEFPTLSPSIVSSNISVLPPRGEAIPIIHQITNQDKSFVKVLHNLS